MRSLAKEAMRIADAHKKGSNSIDSIIFKIYINRTLQVLYDILAANFPGGHKNLVRSGKECFELNIKSRILEGHILFVDTINADVIDNMRLIVNFKKSISINDLDMNRMIRKDGNIFNLIIPNILDDTTETSILIPGLMMCLLSAYKTRHPSVYFPAERGGLTLANKSLTLHFYSNMGTTHANSLDSELTNVSTQFLSLLLEQDDNRTEFAPLVEDFEKRALHGSVIPQKNPNKLLTLAFKQDGKTFQLAKSASSIKELAVFLFYLRCVAKKGETVVLEEP